MADLDGRIIILILFVVISGVKWFFEQIKNKGSQAHEVSESLEEIYDDFREEIRQRQTTAQQLEQPQPLPTPQVEYVSPPVTQTFEVEKPQLSAQERIALANLKKRSEQQTHTKQNVQQGSLKDLFSSSQSAKQAILLHEILGKPKALQK